MNAIYRPAAGCETLCCGFNQGIYLGSIKTRMTSIQFEIGFHHQDCFNTLSSISIVVHMALTLGLSTVIASTPCFQLSIAGEPGSRDRPRVRVASPAECNKYQVSYKKGPPELAALSLVV